MLGFVPQDDSLHRSLTVETLLTYSDRLRSPHRRRDRDARIKKVCGDLDIKDEWLERRIDELSGGQRKRVSVTLEILADPRLLMLDEPTSGLDAGMDNEVMDILGKMAQGEGQDEQRRRSSSRTPATTSIWPTRFSCSLLAVSWSIWAATEMYWGRSSVRSSF